MGAKDTLDDRSPLIVEMQEEAYLTVTPPRGVGKPIDKEGVLEKIRKKRIANVNEDIVREVLDIYPGVPVRITGDLNGIDLAQFRAQNRDGFADLISKEDDLYLSVYPPRGQAERLEYGEVEKYFKENRIVGVDHGLVRKVVTAATGEAVKIGSKSDQTLKEAVEISVSEDAMEARIIIHSRIKDLVPIDPVIIFDTLKERGIVYGIDEKKVEQLSQGKGIGRQVVVARGDKDIVLERSIEIPYKGETRIMRKEEADYYLQDKLPSVKKGQVLITHDSGEKRLLRNVRGQVVSSFDLKSTQGRNTAISVDRRQLAATIGGRVYLSEGRVHVEREAMAIKGNVDPCRGDIRFAGDVFVSGSVLSGSNVEAVGNVEVSGGIKEAKITSIEGSVEARSVRRSTITAKEDILIEEAVDSTLIAYRQVCVEGENGIIGGKVAAGVGIKAVNVGSSNARRTELFIISRQAFGVLEELRNAGERELRFIQEEIEQSKEELDKVGERLNTEEEKELLFREMKNYFGLEQQIAALTSRRKKLENMVIHTPRRWRIEVTHTLYPGTLIHIGATEIERKTKLDNVVFYDDKGQVKRVFGGEQSH